jgi:hypothetical protein
MPLGNDGIERKYRLFAQLDPKHELELDGTFIAHLVLPFCALCLHTYIHPTWSAVLIRLGRAMPNFAITEL